MTNRRVYLYAFDRLHKLEDCKFLENEAITIRNISAIAEWMASLNGCIRTVYAVDNRYGLYRDYLEASKTSDFVKHIEFEDMVSHEGLQIVNR